jgi:hypothetical protein
MIISEVSMDTGVVGSEKATTTGTRCLCQWITHHLIAIPDTVIGYLFDFVTAGSGIWVVTN